MKKPTPKSASSTHHVIPLTDADFAWTAWTPARITARARAIVKEHKKIDEIVKKIPRDQRTFANTIRGDQYPKELYNDWANISMLSYVSPKESVRKAANEAVQYLSEQFVDINNDPDMYRAFLEYDPASEILRPADLKLYEDTVRSWRRRGFELAPQKFAKLKDLRRELGKLENEFEENLNEYHDEILVTQGELEGMTPDYISRLAKKGDRYVVTLKYPDSSPFMQFATSQKKRQELGDKLAMKGGKKSLELLQKIIRLRFEIARMLGYATHADFVLEEAMAKTPAAVTLFQDQLIEKLRGPAERDLERLRQVKRELGLNDPERVRYFEKAYLVEIAQEQDVAVRTETIREYFPFDHVRTEAFRFFEKLFSVRFAKISRPLWHPDADIYEVSDAKGILIGYAAFDLYPRQGKFGHMAVWNFRKYSEVVFQKPEQGVHAPFSIMVGNFPKSSASHPSLISHDEVATYFHEFGHLMHGILSQAPHSSQSGTSVNQDFVELPSQMFENWIWEPKVLAKLSRHYITGKPMPKKLILQLMQTRFYMQAIFTMRQLLLSKLDMTLHMGTGRESPRAVYVALAKELWVEDFSPKSLFPAGFGHLNGYDAGYYTYLWSLVYAYDCYSVFKQQGVTNHQVAKKYRTEILAPGSSHDEMESLKKFLGRDPNDEAFLNSLQDSK